MNTSKFCGYKHVRRPVALLLWLSLVPITTGCGGEPPSEDTETDEITVADQTLESAHETVPFDAEVVRRGDYNVVALNETVPREARDRVSGLLRQEHGDRALAWTVEEEDGTHYAFAYPRGKYDASGEREGRVDPRLETFRMALLDAVAAKEGSESLVSTCHTLYQYGTFCTGKSFDSCGQEGTSSPTGRLANYGFDNYASCYFTWSTSNAVDVFDGNYQTYHVGLILDDWWQFNATFDNKASSLINYY